MASSLLALIDDITTILDDVALLAKVAAKKTAGVLGDDLALNAQQVSGFTAERELPVVWAVARGSFVNKAILVPAALALSALAPWAVTPLLMAGGAFLCFEAFEKLAHKYLHRGDAEAEQESELLKATARAGGDLKVVERDKIKGAIRTDFILSAEIIAITLGTVQGSPFMTQVLVLSGIAIAMTVGVYGLVGGIVKLDDAGYYLSQRRGGSFLSSLQSGLGRAIVAAAPWLMKVLSVAGTAAMFLVGGSILVHGTPPVQEAIESLMHGLGEVPGAGAALEVLAPLAIDMLVGIIAGAAVLVVVTLTKRLGLRRRTA